MMYEPIMSQFIYWSAQNTSSFKHYGVKQDANHPPGSGKRPHQRNLEKKQLKAANDLLQDMKSRCRYGVKIGEKRYYNMYEVDFQKYRTTPVSQFEKDPIGVCWDYTNYEHSKLDELGIPNNNYMFVREFSDGDLQTHSFTIAKIGDESYWFEVAHSKFAGLNKVDSYKDVIKQLLGGTKDPYDIYEYNPDGMDI